MTAFMLECAYEFILYFAIPNSYDATFQQKLIKGNAHLFCINFNKSPLKHEPINR